jgi:hypothetical protein
MLGAARAAIFFEQRNEVAPAFVAAIRQIPYELQSRLKVRNTPLEELL